MPNVGHWSIFVGHDSVGEKNVMQIEPVCSRTNCYFKAWPHSKCNQVGAFLPKEPWKKKKLVYCRIIPWTGWFMSGWFFFLPSISQFLAAASSRKAEWEGLFEVPFKDGWLQARNMKLFRFVTPTGFLFVIWNHQLDSQKTGSQGQESPHVRTGGSQP